MAATAGKSATKSEIFNSIAEATQLSRKQVSAVFDALGEEIRKALGKKGPQVFAVPGLMKITIKHKPATKEQKKVNPFTGLEQVYKAKPASRAVKVRPLKNLKDMVA